MADASNRPQSFAAHKGLVGIVGPTVDDDIRRAIDRYGAEQVELALKRLTKQRAGRKTIADMTELSTVFEEDARSWLEGNDPFLSRTNYAIARDLAGDLKGHPRAAAIDRVERKLRTEPFGRKWRALAAAFRISYSEYPFALHMKALLELAKIDPEWVWDKRLEDIKLLLSAHEYRTGAQPDAKLSMKQIEEVVELTVGALSVVSEPQQQKVRGEPL